MRVKLATAAVAFMLGCAVSTTGGTALASTNLTGDNIQVEFEVPDYGIDEALGTITAPGTGTFGSLSYSVSGNQIILSADNLTEEFGSDFEGLVFTATSGSPNITGATLASVTNTVRVGGFAAPIPEPTFTANSVSIDFNGVSFGDGGQLVYDLSFPSGVPEPATWAMMLTGFGAIGAALRRPARRPAMAA